MNNVEYSIISRGSEKYFKHGYMLITKSIDNKRYILNQNHNSDEIIIDDTSLEFNDDYSIYNIAVSRFGLISRLLLDRINIEDNIFILGMGNIGFSLLIELLKKGYKNINIYSRSIKNDLKSIEEYFNVKLNVFDKIRGDSKVFIDTTGSSDVIKTIFECLEPMSSVIILSTPRDNEYLIDPLMVNRKNLTIYGGHEIFGYRKNKRKELFKKILQENKELESILIQYINIHDYSEEELNNIYNNKTNIIDIFKY